ncbi:MAG: intein-containing RctB family protein [Candidatus Thermoplasmatota archaeon]|nr:intein-containing RctB family protein [Candidatus Thermoplasmatota archaeon]
MKKIDDFRYEIPSSYKGEKNNLKMQTSAIIYADEKMISSIKNDNALEQTANMTMLPGIVGKAMAMPDIHLGYGFPIGGVAATDAENGVISPGGVGFDINCIYGDAEILHEHGYKRKIRDFEKEWHKERIKCANFGKKIKNTKINAFMKSKTKKKIYNALTKSGKKIIATGDHPFYTPDGMVPLKDIKEGEMVAIFPFDGIEFSQPSNKNIVTEEDISKLPLNKDVSQTINELKKRELLPLKANNEKLPYLLKLFGYALGDGTIYFSKNKGTIWFYGEPGDLEDIQEDVEKLGFKASRIYDRKREHEIKTMYDTVKFSRVEYSIKTTSSSLAALLWAMGLAVGNKCSQDYILPKWIFDLELWQKRLFLASLFGAELTTPSTVTKHDYNFYSPVLSLNKHEKFQESGHQLLVQIKELLEDFDVKSSIIKQRKEFVNKEGRVSYRLRLQISSTMDNLINLWSKIGFEYNKKRRHIANVAVQYIQLKKKVLKEREKAEKAAKEMKESGLNILQIYNDLKSNYVNRRFIERSIYDGRKTSPRIAHDFPKFNEFMQKRTSGLGKSGLIWCEIEKKTSVRSNRYVYDFNVADSHHNFIANNFVVSNCGVRLVRTNLHIDDLDEGKIHGLVDEMFKNVPSGLGSKAKVRLSIKELEDVLKLGARWGIENNYGWDEDLEFLEENGCLEYADLSVVSQRAKQRGASQLGSLGAGNHFLEIQKVEEIFDSNIAKTYGIKNKGQIVVMIHTGSRGFGHQVCTDHLRVLEQAVKKYNIWLPDKQLACAPVNSHEGKNYFKAMACAANFAWCNRQMIVHWVRESFERIMHASAEDLGMHIVYDVCHNIAKLEEHEVNGKKKKVCVHRKGATRSFGPGRKEVPLKYRDVGQPVLIPGDMGTESYLLHGTDKAEETFGSTCHGAGRVLSRTRARKNWRGEDILRQLKNKGIYVHPASFKVVAEEAPDSYKDVRNVVDVAHGAGISRKVVKFVPLGVVKG